MTYNQAYSKIIDAYFRDEIQPFFREFCFCGTLAPDCRWRQQTWKNNKKDYPYLMKEYSLMEDALLNPLGLINRDGELYQTLFGFIHSNNPRYEDALFAGMSAALDVLKQIHIDRGEIIDEPQQFTQRKPISV